MPHQITVPIRKEFEKSFMNGETTSVLKETIRLLKYLELYSAKPPTQPDNDMRLVTRQHSLELYKLLDMVRYMERNVHYETQ